MATAVVPLVDEAELVIVGAGPAGSSCAARAAERGLEVILIDQDGFPRDKPCGDGLKRAGVAALHEFGLTEIVDASHTIEGYRMVFDYDRTFGGRFHPRPYLPCCIPRMTLDNAILNAATTRGARFFRGRVEGPLLVDGDVKGVEIKTDSGRVRISGRIVVAADGATSRMRRTCGADRPARLTGYALRQYFVTDRELDPLFEIYAPLSWGQTVLAGYGWVFPSNTHLANIGLGIMRAPGLMKGPSLRALFEAFVETIGLRCSNRFGELRAVGKISGAPVPLSFSPERCAAAGALFAGDAAHMVDPLTGEGIVYALRGGAMAADNAVRRLRNPRVPAMSTGLGVDTARRFPRLVQNPALLARAFVREMQKRVDTGDELAKSQRRDVQDALIESLKPLVVRPDERQPHIVRFVESISPQLAGVLKRWNDELLDTLRTEFPLVSELMHRQFRGCSGPTLATTLLLSSTATGGDSSDFARRAGLASELVRLAHLGLSEIPLEDHTRRGHARSCLGVLTSDLCFTRWMELTARTDARICHTLIATNAQVCVWQMLERRDLFNVERTPERYREAVSRRAAPLHESAATIGAELAEASRTTVAAVGNCGRELGISLQIADDVIDLLGDDRIDAADPGNGLLAGSYTLPVIYALEEEPQLRGRLTPSLRSEEVTPLLAEIRHTDGIARAAEDCRAHAVLAREALEAADMPLSSELHQLITFAPQRVAAAMSAIR
jgi:menaquinone-9 beta-reductase